MRTTHWAIDSVNEIGGHPVEVFGAPRVIDTPEGPAVEFSGDGEQRTACATSSVVV